MKVRCLYRVIAVLLLVCCLISLSACGDKDAGLGGVTNGDDLTEEELAEYSTEQLVALLRQVSVWGLPEDFDAAGKTPGEIVAATGDPYAAYFTAEQYAAYISDLNGNFVGIGVSVEHYTDGETDGIRLLAVYPGSPAEEAGLTAGDIIVAVEGVETAESGYSAALTAVAGEEGSSLTLTCLRDGARTEVALTRAACVKQTVFHRMYRKENAKIGYVYITVFDTVTSAQLIAAVDALEEEGVDSIIFDLRNNPGGNLLTVCEILAYLLPDGDICRIRYAYEAYGDKIIRSAGDTLDFLGSSLTTLQDGSPLPVSHSLTVPTAVLINGGTASAAELFTSALRDYAAQGKLTVTLFGENSYGKGCMQSSYRLRNGDWVKCTVALYDPPCGINYDGVGICPDTEVADTADSVSPRFFGTPDPVIDAALVAL